MLRDERPVGLLRHSKPQQVFADLKAKYCSVTATWQGQATGVPQLLNEAHLAGQPIDIVPDGTNTAATDLSTFPSAAHC